MKAILRTTLLTLLGCSLVYPLLVLAGARVLAPEAAQGSLVHDARGRVVGSRLVAQRFERDVYLWPRPSSAGFDAMAAAASNLAASNPQLRERARATIERLGPTEGAPIPADLVTASGSGLDPHVTLSGARWQAPRIARARAVALPRVLEVLDREARDAGGFGPALVNVLEANLALDRELGPAGGVR